MKQGKRPCLRAGRRRAERQLVPLAELAKNLIRIITAVASVRFQNAPSLVANRSEGPCETAARRSVAAAQACAGAVVAALRPHRMAILHKAMQYLNGTKNTARSGITGCKSPNLAASFKSEPVQILVNSRAQADRVWQLLVDQWEIDRARVWIGYKPAFEFRRGEDGEPILQRPFALQRQRLKRSKLDYRQLKVAALMTLSFAIGALLICPHPAKTTSTGNHSFVTEATKSDLINSQTEN